MNLLKKFLATAACSMALVGFGNRASAAVIDFDANGGADGFMQVNTFDFVPGNSLSVGSVQAIANFLSGAGSTEFNFLYQARLGRLLDGSNNVVNFPGLGTSYEITAVVGLTERVLNVASFGGNVFASFTVAAAPTINFLQFYYHSTLTANDLTGAGFVGGTLIMQASITHEDSIFFANINPPYQVFDQYNANNYPGQTTVTGTGSFSFQGAVQYVDNNFFRTLNPQDVISLAFANGNFELPYRQVDPSQQFLVGTPYQTVPVLGPVNGLFQDLQAQADANGSFDLTTRPVPEPASVVLYGLGASILLIGKKLRSRRRSA